MGPPNAAVASLLALAVALTPATATAQAPLTVFAAASLANAFENLGRAWQASGGTAVRFSFAASSALARQIEQGAPAAVFASADEQWMDYLAARKLIAADTRRVFARNRLVLVVPADRNATLELKPGVDLAAFVGNGRIATGDPAHVPVGRYAQAALISLGAWTSTAPRLVRADSVRVALSYVERGEAAAGIVYATDAAVAQRVRIAGTFPPSSHPPIAYPIAAFAGPSEAQARAFVAWLGSVEARTILRRYGFGDP